MRYRIPSLIAIVTVIALVIAWLIPAPPPKYVRNVIDHLAAIQLPIGDKDFHAHISKCQIAVSQKGGHEFITLWGIAHHEAVDSSSGPSYVYGMFTEHAPGVKPNQRIVTAVSIYRQELKMGAPPMDKIIWSRDVH